MRLTSVASIFVSLVLVIAAGCAMLASPEWSENYALEAECTVPDMIDGSMYSSGQTQIPEYIKGEAADDTRFLDVVLTFSEPKELRKVVLRRRPEDNVPIDVNIFAMIGGDWKLISETTRGAGADDVDIHIRTNTNQLKIRTQRSTRTAKGKSALAGADTGVNRRTQMESILRQPVKFAEVEVYGLKPKTEKPAES